MFHRTSHRGVPSSANNSVHDNKICGRMADTIYGTLRDRIVVEPENNDASSYKL